MRSPFSPKSVGLFVVFALLAVAAVFSERFLREETATESAQHIEETVDRNRSADTAEKGPAPQKSEPPPDRTIKELVRSWNHGNAEEIAGLFVSDGTLLIPTGSQIQSRSEIKKTISEQRAGVLKETTLTNTVDNVSRPDPETAVVRGTYKLDGIRILGFSTSATGGYVLRQIKREGRWLIARAEVTKGDNG